MTTYLSTYDINNKEERVYTINSDGSSSLVADYIDPINNAFVQVYGELFVPGFDGIAYDYKKNSLLLLGEYTTFPFKGIASTLPILSYSPSESVNKFSYTKLNSPFSFRDLGNPVQIPFVKYNTTGDYPSYLANNFVYLNGDSTNPTSVQSSFKNQTKNTLAFGNDKIYAFAQNIQGKQANTLYEVDPNGGNNAWKSLGQLNGAVHAMAYDPIVANHRLFVTEEGSGADQLYEINLDKLGQKDGIKKIGDQGIGFSNVSGLVFDKGALYGFTEDGKKLILDRESGQGIEVGSISGITGKVTGIAARDFQEINSSDRLRIYIDRRS